MCDFKPEALTIHVVSPEKAVNYKWEKGSEKLKNISILSVDELNALPVETRNKYFQTPVLEEGMVLILDRINNTYYPIATAKETLPQNKNRAIDHIAALLGAKSIKREIVTRQTSKRKFDASGNIQVVLFKADSNYSKQEKEMMEKKYTGQKSFAGTRTLDGYNQAVAYCKQTGLINDPGIYSMLEDRNPNHPNPILAEEYAISLTNEVEEITELAFNLTYGTIFSLSGKINEALESSHEMTLSFNVEYGN